MTTYSANLAKSEMVGMPELYELEYAGTIDRYTSWGKNLTFLSNIFTTAPIKRTGFSFDHQFSAVKTTITAPMLSVFVQYIANQPMEPTKVTIYRAISDDLTQYVILFTGWVMGMSVKDMVCSAQVEANSDVMDTVIPQFMHQSFCNHQVFDGQCALSDSSYVVAATVSGISGADYTTVQAGLKADGYYTGGVAEAGTDQRLITNHVGNILTLQVPFDARVKVDDVVDIYPGCDGSPDTCRDKFDNYTNSVGFPYIPSSNPVIWGLGI